jgi:hypothetical protein
MNEETSCGWVVGFLFMTQRKLLGGYQIND